MRLEPLRVLFVLCYQRYQPSPVGPRLLIRGHMLEAGTSFQRLRKAHGSRDPEIFVSVFFGYVMPVCACRHIYIYHDGTVKTRTPLDPLRVGDGARGCA